MGRALILKVLSCSNKHIRSYLLFCSNWMNQLLNVLEMLLISRVAQDLLENHLNCYSDAIVLLSSHKYQSYYNQEQSHV